VLLNRACGDVFRVNALAVSLLAVVALCFANSVAALQKVLSWNPVVLKLKKFTALLELGLFQIFLFFWCLEVQRVGFQCNVAALYTSTHLTTHKEAHH
jgi:hypothetical protein